MILLLLMDVWSEAKQLAYILSDVPCKVMLEIRRSEATAHVADGHWDSVADAMRAWLGARCTTPRNALGALALD